MKKLNQPLDKSITKYLQDIEKEFINLPWENKDFYQMWLAQTFYFVRHSTRLIALTASQFPLEYTNFSNGFIEYIDDEVNHEKLCIADLKAFDKKIENFVELSTTSSLYQTQYYWIQHVNPFCFYGYIMALEGFAVKFGDNIHGRVEKAYTHKACSFVRVHVKEDIDRLKQAFEKLKQIPEEYHGHIFENFQLCVNNYLNMLHQIATHVKSEKFNIAA